MAKITTVLFGELAFIPEQASAPIKESLSFKTDLMVSYDGTEERIQLRDKPRQSFEYSIPLKFLALAKAFNTEYGAIRKKWAVPIWTEGQYIGFVSDQSNSILCNTTIYDLRPSSLALLYAGSNNYRIVEISTISETSIVLSMPVEGIDGAWLLPIRIGWIVGNISKPTNGYEGNSSVTFEIDDNLLLSPTTPEQYLGDDIYYEPGLLDNESVSKAIQQKEQIVDFDLGPIERRTPWKNAKYASLYNSVQDGASEMRKFKEFIYRRAGRFRSFWLPSFESNMRIENTGIIVSTLLIKDDSLTDYTMRSHIAIKINDNTWHPFVITNPINIGNGITQITLSSALNLHSSKVVDISFLGLHRFDTDQIEISWIGNNVSQTSINILELIS